MSHSECPKLDPRPGHHTPVVWSNQIGSSGFCAFARSAQVAARRQPRETCCSGKPRNLPSWSDAAQESKNTLKVEFACEWIVEQPRTDGVMALHGNMNVQRALGIHQPPRQAACYGFRTGSPRRRSRAKSMKWRSLAVTRRPSWWTRWTGSGAGSNASSTVCRSPECRSGPI